MPLMPDKRDSSWLDRGNARVTTIVPGATDNGSGSNLARRLRIRHVTSRQDPATPTSGVVDLQVQPGDRVGHAAMAGGQEGADHATPKWEAKEERWLRDDAAGRPRWEPQEADASSLKQLVSA